MIECKDILALCDTYEPYLLPLDIHILRQRYNGRTFESTYAVGRAMGLSDETVRTIESRALDALLHCRDLEDNGQAITPTRLAKSFRQPIASGICRGFRTYERAAVYTAHRGELVILASRASPRNYPSILYPCGAIIGRVLLVDCEAITGFIMDIQTHKCLLRFEQPEHFAEPIPYAGSPSYFYIDNAVAQQLPPRYALVYR